MMEIVEKDAKTTATDFEELAEPVEEDDLIDEAELVEVISIDGMCGVY